MNILKGLYAPVLLIALLSACSTAPLDYSKDKYYTWVDDQGRVQYSLIKKEANPLIKEDTGSSQSTKALAVDASVNNEQTIDNEQVPDSSEESGAAGKAPSEALKTEAKIVADEAVVKDMSSASDLESDSSSVINSNENSVEKTNIKASSKSRQYNATEINEDEYIDGDELARNNYVRPGDEQRYYTWVDGEGRMVNSPYNPDDSEVTSDNKVVKRFITPLKPEISKAIISSAQSLTPLKIDSKASEIFGLQKQVDNGKSWYQSLLTDECCTDLSYEVITELDMEENMLIELNFMSEKHAFRSGESAYEVVLLPVSNRDYYLRLRTFFKDAVFIPTLVFLDENLIPTRVIQDIALTYTRETGSSYAYLEGIMNVEYQSKNERFFVVLTTEEDMEKVTIVDTKKQKLKQITHGPLGSLGIYVYQ